MPPLIFVHGLLGAPSSWDATRAYLCGPRSDHAVMLCGHGNPAIPLLPPNTFLQVVAQLAQTLIQLPMPPPFHLVGYSLGARLSLALAWHHPHLVRAATLIGVHPGLRTHLERCARRQSDATWLHLLGHAPFSEFIRRWAGQPLFASQSQAPAHLRVAQQRVRESHCATSLAPMFAATALATMPDFWPTLAPLSKSIPLHLIAGANDGKFCAILAAIQQCAPAARTTILPACGHNPLLEAPAALAALLTVPI